jgi:uncharacterized protein (DUF983 family)
MSASKKCQRGHIEGPNGRCIDCRTQLRVAASPPPQFDLSADSDQGDVAHLECLCGAGLRVYSGSDMYFCSACGIEFALRECPKCPAMVRIRSSDWGTSVRCPGCGAGSLWSRWERNKVTALDLAEHSGVSQDLEPDADRRAISGVIVASTGFPRLARGIRCQLTFSAEQIVVLALGASGDYQQIATVPYEDALLRVDGRGAMSSTQGGGIIGGGFGVQGFVEGALIASAINSVTRKTTTSVETFIHLNARGREMLLFNQEVTPQVLQVRMAPVFARIEAAKTRTSSPSQPVRDRVALLKELGELRASGVLTEDEFQAEKARILESS